MTYLPKSPPVLYYHRSVQWGTLHHQKGSSYHDLFCKNLSAQCVFYYLSWFAIFKYDGPWYVVKTAFLKRCQKYEFSVETGVVHKVCRRLGEFGDSTSMQLLLLFLKSKVVQASLQKVRMFFH